MAKIVLFANTDWYLFNFRLSHAINLKTLGHEVVLISPPGDYTNELQERGLQWVCLPFKRRGLNPFVELVVIFKLFLLLRRIQPDLIHAFTLKCAIYSGIAGRLAKINARVSSLTGLGYVFTSDGLLAASLRPILKLVLRIVLSGRRSHVIVQNSDDAESLIKERIAGLQAIHIVRGSGVDPDEFRGQPAQICPEVRVLFVGRLLEDKGVREFVEAANLLRTRIPHVSMLAAGECDPGNPSSIPTEEVKQWADGGAVEFLGHVNEIAELMRTVQIVALPSYREGLPRVLLEAGASSLPVIATDVPGCRELVEHGVDGVLIAPRSAEALASAIEALARCPRLRTLYGEALRTKVIKEYSNEVVAERTLAVYADALALRNDA